MNNEHEDVLPVPGVASQKVRPVITPEAFCGELTASRDKWIGHFESVARTYQWLG